MKLDKWRKPNSFVTRAELRARIAAYSTEPFADVVAHLLNVRPNQVDLLQWATQHPDRWAKAIEIFSRLAGYSEKMDITHTHSHLVSNMSDAQMLQELATIRGQVLELSPEEYKSETSKQIQQQFAPEVINMIVAQVDDLYLGAEKETKKEEELSPLPLIE